MNRMRLLVICLSMFFNLSLFAQDSSLKKQPTDSSKSITLKGKIPKDFKGAQKIRIIARKWQPREEVKGEDYYKSNWQFISQESPDANGNYTFRNLTRGKYYLLMFADDRREISKTFEVAKNKKPKIELRKQNANLKVVVLSEHIHPVPNALCNMMNDLELPFKPTSEKSTTDKNGEIEFQKLTAGQYSIVVMKDGFLPAAKHDIKIEENAYVSIEISLQKSAVVNFVLDKEVENMIEKPLVILNCTAKNLDTNKFYKAKVFNSQSATHQVYLQVPDDFKNKNLFTPHLNLPTGRYLLEYSLYQYGKSKDIKVENPFFTGKTEVDIKAGQTKDVILKYLKEMH